MREKKRQTLQLKLEILARYRTSSFNDLESRIARGQVVEHPAWEEYRSSPKILNKPAHWENSMPIWDTYKALATIARSGARRHHYPHADFLPADRRNPKNYV